jgi:O-antigen/teichoic acid export membrane protein
VSREVVPGNGLSEGADGAASPGTTSTAIRGGAIRVAGYGVGVLVSLGAATVLVRHLGVSTFGRYVTVTSLIGLVGGVTEAGIYVYGIREYGVRSQSERRDLMAQLLSMRLCLTVVGIAGAVCFAVAVGYRAVIVFGALVAGVGLLVQVTADVLSITLQARLELGRLAAIDLVRRVLALLFIALLALTSAGIVPFLAASTAAAALALAILARVVRSAIKISLEFDWRAWRQLFADTLPFAVATSIGAIYFYVTIIIMSLIASEVQTGFFATSFRVIQVALGIPILLLTAIFPLMSRGYVDQRPQSGDMVGKVFRASLICGVWMSLATAIGAQAIIDVVAGHQGSGAVSVLRIQALVLALTFISTSSVLGLISLRNYRAMIVASSSSLLLDIVLALVLVPTLGARGGALADAIVEALLAVGLTLVLVRAVPRHTITGSAIYPVLVAAALAMLVLVIPISPAARAIAATIIYFAVLLRLRAIPVDLLDAARRLLPRSAGP